MLWRAQQRGLINMSYLFFVAGIPLPITPSSLKIGGKSLSQTEHLINGGEIRINRGHGLRTISFDCLLQNGTTKYPFANYRIGNTYTAAAFIVALKALIRSCKPFQFIVTRISPAGKILFFTNIKCTLGDYEIVEDAETLGADVMFHLTLQEYFPYGTKTATITTAEDGTKVATITQSRDDSSFEIGTEYTVQAPDTLFNVGRALGGSTQISSQYSEKEIANILADYNNISDKYNIPPNTTLEVPYYLQRSSLQELMGVQKFL